MARIRYRVWQFFSTFWHRPTESEMAAAEAWLDPALSELFSSMSPAEQAHALRVFTTVKTAGFENRSLLEAALLHDVGKTLHPIHPLERALVVLGNAFVPRMVERWGQGEPKGWRKAFVVGARHAEWGAQMLAEAGASDLTVRLVCQHQTASPGVFSAEEAELMDTLRAADNES